MGATSRIQILELGEAYRDWACRLLEREWGATIVVTRGRSHEAANLPGFVAVRGDRPVGLTTYRIEADSCELMTLNSLQPRLGIGSALVAAVRNVASNAGCNRLWLITTNDNVSALRFYQQRGFSLAAFHKDAIEQARLLKPEIPKTGLNGIPVRDEIELEIILSPSSDEPVVSSIHHAQITIPKGEEEAARHFYCQILGLLEIDKPDSLRDQGGFWLMVGNRNVHVGTEVGVDRYSTRAHLAYTVSNLTFWRNRIEAVGTVIEQSIPLPGYNRFQFRDPFGNRIEFLERSKPNN
jgi:catechol 2,3-dioxygenase-like lactoylglutathione lyase family enzyme/ribosomal protein S18 acetylase RimI-like enzyme